MAQFIFKVELMIVGMVEKQAKVFLVICILFLSDVDDHKMCMFKPR